MIVKAERIKKYGEVFTPDTLVNEILDKLPQEVWEEGKTFLDNSCGNGQFLLHVLIRKIKIGLKPLDALLSIYGADVQPERIKECRNRLLQEASKHEPITLNHIKAVMKNIVCVKKFPNGSLDYEFNFNNSIKDKDAEKWLKYFQGRGEEPEVKSEPREDEIDFS